MNVSNPFHPSASLSLCLAVIPPTY